MHKDIQKLLKESFANSQRPDTFNETCDFNCLFTFDDVVNGINNKYAINVFRSTETFSAKKKRFVGEKIPIASHRGSTHRQSIKKANTNIPKQLKSKCRYASRNRKCSNI